MALMKEIADDELRAVLFHIQFRASSSNVGEALLDLIH